MFGLTTLKRQSQLGARSRVIAMRYSKVFTLTY